MKATLKEKAIKEIECLEKWAKERYVNEIEWCYIIGTLTEDEFVDLNKAHIIAFGNNYSIQPK